MAKAKTILFVALPYSVHTARWIAQLHEQGYELHLFPSIVTPVHPKLTNITVHYGWSEQWLTATHPHQKTLNFWLERLFGMVLRRLCNNLLLRWRGKQLASLIERLQPDVIHAMEMQAAGYLTFMAKNYLNHFPVWIVTNWGSDIFLYGKQPKHQTKIQQVLANCDFYTCECERDVHLARQFGFKKKVLSVTPNTGGFDLAHLHSISHESHPSERRVILLKGYQHFAGRALIGLQALISCVDVLHGYTIVIYSAFNTVIKAAKLFTKQTGIAHLCVPQGTSHDEMLSLHANARVSIALSISDGISTSLLEAMVMGSFPIQTCTSCADEWIEHGVSGAIVPVDEPEIIAMWIRKALSDDELVNHAAQINWQTALNRLDSSELTQQAISIYEKLS